MATITITVTEAEQRLLTLSLKDTEDWATNLIRNKARVTLADLKQTPEWETCIAKVVDLGLDPTDPDVIVSTGLSQGILKTKFELSQIAEAKATAEVPTTTPHAIVDSTLILKKIQHINTLANDGVVVSTAQELTARLAHFQQLSTFLARKEAKNTITPEETAILDNIETGYLKLMQLEQVAIALKAQIDNGNLTASEIPTHSSWNI